METGFFSVADTWAIESMTLEEGKLYCISRIKAQSNARPGNISKATMAVNKSSTVTGLMLTIANFLLARPSENLKSIS